MIMNALVAELKGVEWTVPPSLHEGINVNPLEEVLSRESNAEGASRRNFQDYANYTPMGVSNFVKLISWHVRERFWRGADRRIVLLPKDVLSYVIEDVRSALRNEGRQIEHVTTGDILVAWIFKVKLSC